MKRPSVWAGIIGAILIAGNSFNLASAIAQPNDILIINIASIAIDAAWIILGIFLVSLYLRNRNNQEAVVKRELDSREDIEILRVRRSWILAFVIVVLFLGSLGSWIVNDYTAGLTLVNIEVIFDLAMNIVLLVIAVQLFRGKKVLEPLFYAVLIYVPVIILVDTLRLHWQGVIINLIAALYFIYAIKAPLNRQHFRIAHLVILPAFFILSIAATTMGDLKINNLVKEESKLEQQFLTQSSILTNAYTSLNQKDKPDILDVRNVQDAAEKTHNKIQDILAMIQTLQSEVESQFPSISQKLTIDNYEKSKAFLEAVDTEISHIQELMMYESKLDFANLSQKQREDINAFKQQINNDDLQIADAAYRLKN